MFTDHSDLKYQVNKLVLGGRICRLNAGPDHLSRMDSVEEPSNLEDNLPDAQLFSIQIADEYYKDIIHFLTIGWAPVEFTK